jgi:hypothetical protein
MDASLWKLLVEKVISRTKSRDLLWSKTDEGPANTLSFGTSIDDRTTLNIWGYKANYSYELCLVKQTEGEPFEERKRVTLKKNAEGISFSGLFEAAKKQVEVLVRERAFTALMEYLADPTIEDPEQQEEFLDRWASLGYDNYFTYSQDEKILAVLRDMTAAGSITWSLSDGNDVDEEGQHFWAEVGDLLYLTFHTSQTPGRAQGATSYRFCISSTDDSDSDIEMQIGHGTKDYERPRRLFSDELRTLILKKVHEDEVMFNEIVRNNIIHDILASLDSPRNASSPLEGI